MKIRIKRRYLFPLLYVVVDAFSILLLDGPPAIPVFISALSGPSIFLMRVVSRTFSGASDPACFAYFVVAGTILQMFVLGIAWELLVDRVAKLFSRKPAVA